MRALGFDVKKAHVQELMRSYDKQNTGFITQSDFEEISGSSLHLKLYLMLHFKLLHVHLLGGSAAWDDSLKLVCFLRFGASHAAANSDAEVSGERSLGRALESVSTFR